MKQVAPAPPCEEKGDDLPMMKLGKRTFLGVPRSVEELSAEWLTSALRYKRLLQDDVHIISVEYKAIGDGAIGEVYAVSFTFSGPTTSPATLVAKFSPRGKAPLPSFVIRSIFKAEAHFYNDFSPATGGLCRPTCYLALYNPRRWKPTFCILLEDLQPKASFTRIGGDNPQVGILLSYMRGIARLHARWWAHPKAPPLDWVLHPAKDFGGLALRVFMRTAKLGLPALVKCFPAVCQLLLSWMPVLRKRHRFIVQECFRPPLTLTHGDAHIENAFFDERWKPDGVVFIDFGNMMFSPGVSDVAFFLLHSLGIEVRRKLEEQLLAHYHSCLITFGVDERSYPYAQCWRDYRFNMWRGLLSLCAMAPGLRKRMMKKTIGDDEMHLYEELCRRCITAMQDQCWLDLVQEGDEGCGPCSGISCCY
ncbi:hypothetical protein AB1Y20_017336 [Prymnesium parvum]|uniref:CHK kinase-like domain-containing protein n=1 Tax=Prymnesium parvum TaxID=97485 RepID=A0AB34JK84_PRYPA